MSQLQVTTKSFGSFRLNVLAFSSPIFGSINGVQTKDMKVWYPIKANQPEVQFDVQFMDEQDYESFQKLIRDSQKESLDWRGPMVHLNWPQRNINNWSGLITEFQSGGMRFNPAPRAKFTVYLFDSYISRYSELATVAPEFTKYFSFASKIFTSLIPNPFNVPNPYNFRLPTPPQTADYQQPGTNNTVTPSVTITQGQQ
jgi:hypothetical protein